MTQLLAQGYFSSQLGLCATPTHHRTTWTQAPLVPCPVFFPFPSNPTFLACSRDNGESYCDYWINVRCLAQSLASGVVRYVMTQLSPPRANKLAEEWPCGVIGLARALKVRKIIYQSWAKTWLASQKCISRAGFWQPRQCGAKDLSWSTQCNSLPPPVSAEIL